MNKSVWWVPRTKPETYSIRWRDPVTGKFQRLKADGKEARDREINRIEKMLLDWKPSDGKSYAIPLVILEDYLNALPRMDKPRRRTTIEMKRKNLTPFCNTYFSMAQITTKAILAYVDSLYAKEFKIDTISIRMRDIRAFLSWCAKEGVVAANPWKDIRIPESTFVGRRLSSLELDKLTTLLEGNCRDFVILAIETGTRRGELLRAEFTDIDFERKFWGLPGREGKSKSRKDRVIPLSHLAIDILLNRQRRGLRFIFEGYTRDMLQNDWNRSKELSGITGRLRIHDLRHTWASNFRGRATSLKAIAGWQTDQMMHHYTHVEIEELREDMEKGKLAQKLAQIGSKPND